MVELQLGGADDILNMNPLGRSVNRSLGSQSTFEEFHELEITEYHDAYLASTFYNLWREEVDNNDIEISKCVGYKIPLFLGGADDISNLELCDFDVYWTICSELIKKTK